MPELRWILLGVGVAFCLGLWWWETRRRGQAADDQEHVDLIVRRRVEPTFGAGAASEPEPLDDFPPEPQADEIDPPDVLEEPREPGREDKIVSMRLFSAPDEPFEGRALVEALGAEGLQHGKFSIFHKYGPDGGRLFSVASLLEPGSFDMDLVDEQSFKGIVFFAVQGEAGEPGLADMRRTAQALAGRLRGTLTPER